jgi:hypothetical protein
VAEHTIDPTILRHRWCSLAGDLRIHRIVGPPTYDVGFTLPLDVVAA